MVQGTYTVVRVAVIRSVSVVHAVRVAIAVIDYAANVVELLQFVADVDCLAKLVRPFDGTLSRTIERVEIRHRNLVVKYALEHFCVRVLVFSVFFV